MPQVWEKASNENREDTLENPAQSKNAKHRIKNVLSIYGVSKHFSIKLNLKERKNNILTSFIRKQNESTRQKIDF